MPPSAPRAGLVVGTVLCGRYRVTRFLRRGGAAEVFLAVDEREHRTVVVKVPNDECMRRAVERERFQREVKFLRLIAHPHVVPFLDQGEEPGFAFVVLAHMPGGSLIDRLALRGTGSPPMLPVADLAHWLVDVSSALDFMHERGVIHRDLSPENVLFDAEGRARVADFGISKAIVGEASLTPSGYAVGKPDFMDPEQILDHKLTGASDQYALATVVYVLLAATPPHPRGSLGTLLLSKTRDDATPLAVKAPHLPASVTSAVDRALRRDPSERFASCLAFARAAIVGL